MECGERTASKCRLRERHAASDPPRWREETNVSHGRTLSSLAGLASSMLVVALLVPACGGDDAVVATAGVNFEGDGSGETSSIGDSTTDASALEADSESDSALAAEVSPISCSTAADCAPAPPCHTNFCDAATHACSSKASGDGKKCATDPACAENGVCHFGRCTVADPHCSGNFACCKQCNSDTECDDGSECTHDTCNGATHSCSSALKAGCTKSCVNSADCDDGVASTADSCTGGMCQHVADSSGVGCSSDKECATGIDCSPAFCVESTQTCGVKGDFVCPAFKCDVGKNIQCDDANPCTLDACGKDGICKHSLEKDCGSPPCLTSADCDDSNVCTQDNCEIGASFTKTCVHVLNPGVTGCCNGKSKTQCDDGVDCTTDTCNSSGKCHHAYSSPCAPAPCATADDCGTSEPCHIATCVGGSCGAEKIVNCECEVTSLSAKPCDDGDACTLNSCKDGKCLAFAVNCSDNNPCTADSCSGGSCSHLPLPGCVQTPCKVSGDCADLDFCTDDFCFDGICKRTPRYCDDGHACTADACDPGTGACTHVGIPNCSGKGS